MKTRSGLCYNSDGAGTRSSKRRRVAVEDRGFDFFDNLPEDIVLMILCKLSATATRPADLLSLGLTSLNTLTRDSTVLCKASLMSVAVRASQWSEPAHRFLEQCVSAGNLEACYTLGMIRFYCLRDRAGGAKMMAKAAVGSHAAAIYSLAVIQFNGSGGSKNDKDLRAGVMLCARAAFLGYVDAIRELGHCLQDGYGVRQNVTQGRRLLVEANALELQVSSSVISTKPSPKILHRRHHHPACSGSCCPLLQSDYGCNVPMSKPHPANQFLVEWFNTRSYCSSSDGDDGPRLCSHSSCGRPETRRHEFRRCSVCGAVNYCSRACQALDWKLRHKGECIPIERWLQDLENAAAVAQMQGLGVGQDVGATDAEQEVV